MRDGLAQGSFWFPKTLSGLIALLVLTGCASVGTQGNGPGDPENPEVSCRTTIQPEEQLQLDAVDEQIRKGQSYAALAKLESEPLGTEQHWLRRGQLYVSTGQLISAQALFETLVRECGSAGSHHGLGLVSMKRGRLSAGLDHLRTARNLAPVSVPIRNDYGFALLKTNDIDTAIYELRTAYELADGKGAVSQNLAVAFLLKGDQAGLNWMKSRYGFTDAELAHAQQISERMRSSK